MPEDVESLGTLPILGDHRFFSDWSCWWPKCV